MYRINIKKFGGFLPLSCNPITAKREMKKYASNKGLSILNPFTGKFSEASIYHLNFLYDKSGELYGLMEYEKKSNLLHICTIPYESELEMKDMDFLSCLTEQMEIFQQQGYKVERYASGFWIKDNNKTMFDVYIRHFRRYRNSKGEVHEEYIRMENC